LAKGINTVTWTATDGANLTATSTQTVTVVDNQAPTIVTLAAISVNADAGVCTYDSSQLTAPTAADNCTTVTVTRSPASLAKGINTVTWTATDGTNLTATSTQTVTVVDNQPPTAICKNISVNLNTFGTASITAADINNNSTDNCGIATLVASKTTFLCANLGSNSVTLTVTDTSGNTSFCIATVTIIDAIAPVALCKPFTLNLNVSGNATLLATDIDNGSSDNCSFTRAISKSNFDCSNVGANTVTLTITDVAGNSSSCTTTITVQSSLAITATSNSVLCAGNTLNLFGNVTSGAFGTPTYSWVGPLGFSSPSQNPSIPNVSMGAAGDYTLTVTNGNGCTASQTTTVIVNPVPNVSISPTFTSGFVKKFTGSLVFYTFTVTNVGLVPDSFNLSYIPDSDPMDVTMDVRFLTMEGTPITATPMISAGGTYTFQLELSVQGNQPRVYNHTLLTATSNLCSNSSVSADAYTYEYNGNKPPAANGSQLEISKVAIDNTTGAVITNAIVGVPFKYKITVVNNSTKEAATNVVINDLVPASLSITDNDGGIQTGNSIRWNVVSLTKIGAGQNTVQKIITVVPTCNSLPSLSNTANVISSPPDNGLGIDAATVNTSVTDNIAPVAICKPITINLNASGVATITESMINNGSSDNCSIQSITISKSSFNCTNIGANNVTLTVTDISGNSTTCTSIVTVVDSQAPVFTSCPTNPASICTDNSTTYTKVGTSWDALANDNCSFTLIYTLSGSTTGSGTSLNGVAFNVGTTIVTWTATDTAGNTANCIFSVTIYALPVITTQPISQLKCEGNIVSFNVVTSGTGLTYTWQRKLPSDASFITVVAGGNISFPIPERIRIDNVGTSASPNGTQFQVIVSNSTTGCSLTSTAATLLVNEVTGISPSATNVIRCYDTNYSYTVSTSVPPPGSVVSYQWKSSVVSGVWNDVIDGVGTHFSGAQTATLNIFNGTPAESAEYKVQVIFTSSGADCTVTTALTRRITFLPELTAPVATITQPDCITSTGSVTLSGLPASGTWTLTRSGTSSATTTGSGTSTIITGLAPGTYTYTVTLGTCTSVPSADVVIQAATTAIWNGTTWTNGPPTINQALEFTGSYDSSGDLTACSCTVTSGAVVFNPSHALKITNWVHINGGSLTFENTSSLVQTNNITNIGNITYKRNFTGGEFDYTYWSSPVAGQNLLAFSSSTKLDKFFSFNSIANDWVQENPATATMTIGKGYIIRGIPIPTGPPPPGFGTNSFIGIPNNGDISVPVVFTNPLSLLPTDADYGVSYLLGNPYPSAIYADQFLYDNQSVINGTLYFWTHNTPIANGTPDPGTGVWAYSGNDYASYNITGGVGTGSGTTALSGGVAPSGKIASGQGFFSTSIATGTVNFTNAMRFDGSGNPLNNSNFYKTKSPKSKTANPIEKHRVWLNLTNTQGAFKQTLVGYISGATNTWDSLFDGESYDGNDFLDFYSILQDKNLTIQGRALPFDENDEIPLGYRVAEEGTFSVVIDQTDGVLSNQAVFIEDKLNNTVFNLKNGKYTFTTAAGTFDDRLVLRYTDKTLGVNELEANDGIVALYSTNYKTLIIRNTVKDATVNSVTLFSLSGQKIAYWDVKGREQSSIQIPIKNLPAEIYIVKIKTTQGDFSKKIIIK
jgi:hypothetical protein